MHLLCLSAATLWLLYFCWCTCHAQVTTCSDMGRPVLTVPSPSATTWCHRRACLYPLYSSTVTCWHSQSCSRTCESYHHHICLHSCHLPVPPLVTKASLFICLSCSSASSWWFMNTCLHVCCVPEQPHRVVICLFMNLLCSPVY